LEKGVKLLTNLEINGKISLFKNRTGAFKISLNVDPKEEKNTNYSCNKFSFTRWSENEMEKMNVNLLEAANCFILLFYRTEQRYSCTRTKLGKLLSIVAFKYARQNEKVFNEKIHRYNDCGSAIIEILNNYDKEIYSCFNYEDEIKIISDVLKEENTLNEDILKAYPVGSIDDNLKENIMEIFLNFGAYSPTQLGECINPIVNQAGIVKENGEIDLSRIYEFSLSDFEIENSIAENLLKYLFS
jgi:uncharacterized phage-associated protein